MRKANSYIFIFFLSLFLYPCNSGTKNLSAHPRLEEPKKHSGNSIIYADTTQPEYSNIIERLDSFYRRQPGFNGSVLIGRQGKVIYERYFGYSDRETGELWKYNSGSQLASTSKTFTAAAVLYLYQHNYLNIDDPVQHYLPEFPYEGITIKMLLDHRSGVPDYQRWVPLHRKDTKTPITNDEVMEMMAQYKPRLDFKPNTRFKYSNANYAVLASLIERVTEMSYREFMRRYIFEPLGMWNTFVYSPEEGLPWSATVSYNARWQKWEENFADGVYGDKNIYSTVRDLYRWDQSFYQNQFLNNETLEPAYTPCSHERKGIKNYGLGWRMECPPDGNKVIYHNGWWHGNNTVFRRYIKENITIIILGNKYNEGIYRQPKVLYSIVKNEAISNEPEEDEL